MKTFIRFLILFLDILEVATLFVLGLLAAMAGLVAPIVAIVLAVKFSLWIFR